MIEQEIVLKEKSKAILTQGPIGLTLIKLTIPMIFGILGMIAFNLVDTFFVGQLGTDELTALSFTFPVVLVISNIALGIGFGASALVSRAVGAGDEKKVKTITTDSLLLSLIIVAFFSLIGFFTIEPIFKLIGAKGNIVGLIKQYMQIWYPGMLFVVVPMVGNNAIRGRGDTFTPGLIMFLASFLNFILDPLFIFNEINLGGFSLLNFDIPKLTITGMNLGIRGAAIATVIARVLTLVVALLVLVFKYKMITFRLESIKKILISWGKILYIGLPTALTRIIIPLTFAFITKLLSDYGKEPVAAFGVATRLEFFIMTVIYSTAIVLGPFVGQNWGAGKIKRVKKALFGSQIFSIVWGIIVFILFSFIAYPVASIFNRNPIVVVVIGLYINIVSISYGLMGQFSISSTVLNVLKKPLFSLLLTVIQMIVICIPLAFIMSKIFDVTGIFISLAFTYIIGGIISFIMLKIILAKLINNKIEMNHRIQTETTKIPIYKEKN